jgi:hypothetical protein
MHEFQEILGVINNTPLSVGAPYFFEKETNKEDFLAFGAISLLKKKQRIQTCKISVRVNYGVEEAVRCPLCPIPLFNPTGKDGVYHCDESIHR